MELFLEPRDMAQMRAARSKPKCASHCAESVLLEVHRQRLSGALTQHWNCCKLEGQSSCHFWS